MDRETKIEGRYLVDAKTGETLGRTFVEDGIRFIVPLTHPVDMTVKNWSDMHKIVHEGFVYVRANDIF